MTQANSNYVVVYTLDPRRLDPKALQMRCQDWLDEREQATHAAFAADLKHNYLCAHGMIRAALARVIGAEPKSLRFRQRRLGKPVLDVPHEKTHFSASHTRGLAAVAISRARPVGMDVEDVGRVVDWSAIAEFFLAGRALSEIQSAAATDQPVKFFEQWVMREALLKSAGCGIPALDRARVRALDVRDGDRVGRYVVKMLPPLGQIVGAVAVKDADFNMEIQIEDGLALFEAGVAVVD